MANKKRPNGCRGARITCVILLLLGGGGYLLLFLALLLEVDEKQYYRTAEWERGDDEYQWSYFITGAYSENADAQDEQTRRAHIQRKN